MEDMLKKSPTLVSVGLVRSEGAGGLPTFGHLSCLYAFAFPSSRLARDALFECGTASLRAALVGFP